MERIDRCGVAGEITAKLVGSSISDIQRRENDWAVAFSRGAGLRISCLWRILIDGRIALTPDDDHQPFGLPAPVDAERRSMELLRDKTIEAAVIRQGTGDLTIHLTHSTALELINDSSGYEGWELNVEGIHLIAKGGGELAILKA